VTILGHIQACPTRFLAQKTFFYIEEKVAKKKAFLGQASLYIFDYSRASREHLPDDFLPPPPNIQTSLPLSESDQSNLVGNFLS